MENNEYRIKSNRFLMLKRMLLTILFFLLAVGFVFIIFYLTIGKKTESWLDGKSGMARTSVYPFVFSSGNDIYTVDENLVVRDIDNSTRDVIYDNIFGKVYYIYRPTQEFFEYDIKENARRLLVSNISSYKLFQQRVVIPFTGSDGSLGYYSFSSKTTTLLRPAIDSQLLAKLPQTATSFVIGDSCIVYYDNFSVDDGTADLMVWFTGGSKKKIDENVIYNQTPVIFKEDAAVSYYKKDGLSFCAKNGSPFKVSGSASIIIPTNFGYAELASTPPTDFDETQQIRYYYVNNDVTGGGIDIYELKINGSKITSSLVKSGARSIVNFDDIYSILVYSVQVENEYYVYSVRPGQKPALLAVTALDSYIYFDTSASLLYVSNGSGEVQIIDTFNKSKTVLELENGVSMISPIFGKAMSVIYSTDHSVKTIVLKQSQTETYLSSEQRLYGKSDSIYLKLRDIQDRSVMSLDLVNGSTVTRITNSCNPSCVVYDKEFENIIYYDRGALYVVKNGTRTLIDEFTDVVRPVNVLTR
ncbi:MAG: hypothetical protein K6B54_00605 [Clostridia bacterium]|nr:hypothetical protein [Clostridia bacterium]